MEIRFNRLHPFCLPSVQDSQVWGKTALFPEGAFVLVAAPSARGKSTLISMLYGLTHAYEGDIHLGDRNLREQTPRQWAELRQKELSIVFQELRLLPGFSGLDNILLKGELSGTTSREEIETMATSLGVRGVLEKKVGFMSRGEKQRIAILRALVQPFKWLLLDEPFSHLDSTNTTACTALIREVCNRQGAGLVITSLDGDTLFPYAKVVRL